MIKVKPVINENTTFLKIIAILTMTVDHIGIILFPGVVWFRIIGRVSFPLFAYCLACGCIYTKDIKKYLLRVLILGIISQPICMWAFNVKISDMIYTPNILFTLFGGGTIIWKVREKKYLIGIIMLLMALIINFDYGISGIGLILIFYFFSEYKILLIFISSCYLAYGFFSYPNIIWRNIQINSQGFSVLSIPIICKKIKIRPKYNKYFFYIYYPLHLFILKIIECTVI